MPRKHCAVEVIPDKLWITYDTDGIKTGMMSPSQQDPDLIIQYLIDGDRIAHDCENISELFEFQEKTEPTVLYQQQVFGYPVPEIETFKIQERENLPCFTKTTNSKIYFAAGYYGINFDNGGWLESFCPKLATLKKYQFVGPFRTQTDAQIAIKRKQRT